MIRAIILKKQDSAERDLGASVDYLRHILRVSLRGFFKFSKVLSIVNCRRELPAAAFHVGLLVATLVRTDSQVSAYANVVVITMAGISGCFVPRDWLPETMQLLSLVTPHAWALIGYHELLSVKAPSLGVVTQSCGMLLGFSLLFFLLGCLRFSRVE